MPPLWRFQLVGGDAFVKQLQSIAEGPVTAEVLRVVPTAEGFLLEHQETQQTPPRAGDGPPRVDVRGARRPHRRGRRLLQRRLGRRAACPARRRGSDGAAVSASTTTTVAELLPTIAARAAEIEAARRVPPRPARRPHGRGLLRRARPHQPRRRRRRHRDRHAPVRRPRRRGRVGGVDRDDRWRLLVRSRQPAARHLRRCLREADPASSWPARSTRPGRSRRSTAATGSRADGGSPAGASTPTGSSATASKGSWTATRCSAPPCSRPMTSSSRTRWTATGMCATASHHFRVEDLSVPPDRTFVPLEGEPCIDEPIARVHTPAFVSLVVSSVALGIARGALEDVFALAGGKVPMLAASPLATNPLFQHDGGGRRCGAAGLAKPAARDRRGDLGGGRRGSTAVARGDRAHTRRRPPGQPSAPPTSSTRRTGSAAGRPSTPTHPCSAGSATSTPSPSTSSCAPTPSPRPAPSSPGRSPTSPSSRPPRHPSGLETYSPKDAPRRAEEVGLLCRRPEPADSLGSVSSPRRRAAHRSSSRSPWSSWSGPWRRWSSRQAPSCSWRSARWWRSWCAGRRPSPRASAGRGRS